MMQNLINHLKRLLDFAGREGRAAFWPYAGAVFALTMVGMFAVMVPFMLNMFTRMQQFASEHPDQATVTRGPGHYSIQIEGHHPELMPDFEPLIAGVALVSLVVVGLLAAAVVRRLHDRGKSGFWGLIPLPFLFYGYFGMSQLFAAAEPDLGEFFLMVGNNFVYIVCLALLVVLLCGRSDPEANAYGLGQGR